MKIKWGIIGAGNIAVNRMIPAILQSKTSKLIAVNRTNPEKLDSIQEQFNVENSYLDVEELVKNPEIHAVYIASPVNLHLKHALISAKHGKQILLEKPVGMNVQEVKEIKKACEENNVFFEAAFMMRFHCLHQKMKTMITNGEIGDLVSIRMDFAFWYSPKEYAWRLDKSIGGGGVFTDLGPHMIDLVQYVSGQNVSKVNSMLDNITFSYEVEDSASVLLGLEGGGHALLSAHFNIPNDIAANRFEVFGTKGVLIAKETIGQEEKGELVYKKTGESTYQVIPHSEGDLYLKEVEAFTTLMKQRSLWEKHMESQILLQKIIDAVYKR